MEKIKIGVFGGARGMTMINILLDHPDAVVTAVCDKYEPLLERAKKRAEEAGIKISCYTDFDEFIKSDIDAVVLANYATEHAVFAVKCLEAGKHVLSECLPSETPAQAVELIEAVEKTGLVYAYAENYCYMRDTFEMWQRYRNGDIDEISYAECDYVHDCSSCWLDITYGEPDHWRNHLFPTFYCTHSLGPVLSATGKRPVQVVGFENPPIDEFYRLGHAGGHASGIEMVTLENGAIVKSIHGPLKLEPSHTQYKYYGKKGYLGSEADETVRFYREGEELCKGETTVYKPVGYVCKSIGKAGNVASHGGSDFYPTHFFIEKILGREDGKWSIDVYSAVDMGMCGIMAFRSILGGNVPVKIPDFRLKEERDKYRFDNACTNPLVAGKDVLPCTSYEERKISDRQYRENRSIWLEHQKNNEE